MRATFWHIFAALIKMQQDGKLAAEGAVKRQAVAAVHQLGWKSWKVEPKLLESWTKVEKMREKKVEIREAGHSGVVWKMQLTKRMRCLVGTHCIANHLYSMLHPLHLQLRNTVEKCSWEIHLRNTLEKYSWEMQLRSTVVQCLDGTPDCMSAIYTHNAAPTPMLGNIIIVNRKRQVGQGLRCVCAWRVIEWCWFGSISRQKIDIFESRAL